MALALSEFSCFYIMPRAFLSAIALMSRGRKARVSLTCALNVLIILVGVTAF
jgi:hypothetical protein